jgi:hypothetical protein
VAATIACVASITGVMLLAVIRGDLFMQEFETMTAPVVIDDGEPAMSQPQPDFYRNTLGYLTAFMLLMTLAMELGAGLALHEGSRMLAPDSEDWTVMRERLALVRKSLAAIIDEACTRKVAPERFVQEFHRDFYRAMLTQTVRNAMTKLLLLGCILASFRPHANAQIRLNLVIAVDLTKSVAVKGPDGKTEFQKNIDGIGKVLQEVPAATKLTIIGITDASFSQPYILLSATVPDDPGYFGERLRAARNQLVIAWKDHSARLEPKFTRTDVIGALLLAGQIFGNETGKKMLVIFSDMRNSTADLNLESQQLPVHCGFGHVDFEASLPRVQVFVLGVDGFGKDGAYWRTLRTFWEESFRNASADLREYSTLRDLDRDR